jgi:hypothetical protein
MNVVHLAIKHYHVHAPSCNEGGEGGKGLPPSSWFNDDDLLS